MANRVYRWKKPELTVTLTAGGTLDASATYYIAGYLENNDNNAYRKCHGPLSDVSTFTTDGTNRSISVSWKTTGDITSFEDGSAGYTIVNSAYHCLTDGNTITINDGYYAGNYAITWIDYNKFRITKDVSGTYESAWRCSVLPNTAVGLDLYISKTAPLDSDGLWAGNLYHWSHLYYSDGYATNPIVVTAPYLLGSSATRNHFNVINFPYPEYADVHAIGKSLIICDTGTVTFDTIKQMLIDAGIDHVNRTYTTTYGGFWRLTSDLYVTTTNAVTLTRFRILLEDTAFQWSYLTLNYGSIIAQKTLIRAIVNCRFINSTLLTDSQADSIPWTQSGENNNSYVALNIAYSTFALSGYRIIGMGYPYGISWTQPLGTFSNSTVVGWDYGIYMVYNYIYSGVQARNLINMSIEDCLEGDLMVYSNVTSTATFEYENIDTTRSNNLKVVKWNQTGIRATTHNFYRKVPFYIVDNNNNTIQDVLINIADSSGHTYEYTSDASGLVTLDLLEQTSTWVSGTGGDSIGKNTIYNNFTINIRKSGYEGISLYYSVGKNISDSLSGDNIVLALSGTRITVEYLTGEPKGNSVSNSYMFSDIVAASDASGWDPAVTRQGNSYFVPYSLYIQGESTWFGASHYTYDYDTTVYFENNSQTDRYIFYSNGSHIRFGNNYRKSRPSVFILCSVNLGTEKTYLSMAGDVVLYNTSISRARYPGIYGNDTYIAYILNSQFQEAYWGLNYMAR